MPMSKDTNPKDAVGTKKVPISTVPCGPILLAGLAMLEGARKYGRHNYRAAGVRASVYYDAVVGRHIMPWWEGQNIDPDSGLNHIDKAIAGLFVLRDSMLSGNWIDDRPVRNPIDLTDLNAKAAAIIDKYPDAKEPYTQSEPANPTVLCRDCSRDGLDCTPTGDIEDPECFRPKSRTCGECEHFAGVPFGGNKNPCCKNGIAAGEPCDPGCFLPKGGA